MFTRSYLARIAVFLIAIGVMSCAHAQIGSMASRLSGGLTDVADLIGSIGYVAGLGFGVASVFKFKQHRDSPTQVPIGTPFAMLGVAVALIYMPQLLTETGASVFSSDVSGGAGGSGNYDTI